MNSTNETIDAARHALDRTRSGADHAASRVRSTFLDGVHAASSAIAIVRALGLDDALGWIGLQRRRSATAPLLAFGAGFLGGAAFGVIFAPMAGTSTRRKLRAYALGIEDKAEAAVKGAEAEVERRAAEVASKVRGVAGEAVDAAARTAQDAEDALRQGATTVQHALGSDTPSEHLKATAKSREASRSPAHGNGKSG